MPLHPHHRIESLRVQGYRSLQDLRIDFGAITVLVGPNGVGKSNILGALKLLPLMRTQSLQRFVRDAGGAAGLMHYGAKVTPAVELTLTMRDGAARTLAYDVSLTRAADDTLSLSHEYVRAIDLVTGDGERIILAKNATESALHAAAGADALTAEVSRTIARMSFFHFHDTSANSALRTPSRAEDARYLRSDGSNLAAYLRALLSSDDAADSAAARRITRAIRRLVPSIKELSPVEANGSVRLEWIDDRDEIFGAHHLSDGALRLIALVTALGQPAASMPGFICIDEPELGLHPAAIAALAEMVRSVTPRCQVVIATQSADLLNHFEPDEIVVAERSDYATTVRRLDAARLAEWLESYTLAELYEKNVLGGRP